MHRFTKWILALVLLGIVAEAADAGCRARRGLLRRLGSRVCLFCR